MDAIRSEEKMIKLGGEKRQIASIVNAFRGMVSIQVNNVLIEWDGILDYENALLVAKLFSKMACVLAKMDEAVQLWTILLTKLKGKFTAIFVHWNRFLALLPCCTTFICCLTVLKCHPFQALKHYPSTRGLTYTVLPSRVKNLTQYEVPIKDVCRQVPTYFVQEQKEGTALAIDPNSCFEVQILSFLRLSICGELPGF
ncbi:hypothetical protein EI555_003073 [Monodon monoceros]|uniref:BRICHOS domain-containing protein n=1 Tax=Monodon monoceros TaxID=40151 RepID=A0A4U1ERB3_MONMO|nr:hypothetical protein EI555_003073 [Monodon monoceros]